MSHFNLRAVSGSRFDFEVDLRVGFKLRVKIKARDGRVSERSVFTTVPTKIAMCVCVCVSWLNHS